MSAAPAVPSPRAPMERCAGPCAGLCTEDGAARAYREHRARLIARARGMLGDRELAEDAVQEVFLRAWSACSTFDPSSGPPLVAWLTAITRNVVIDLARARAARPRLHHAPPADAADESTGASPIDRALLRMVLVDALGEVSADHRGIVLRAVLHDRPYADVAVELDLPVGTVKSRVHYALRDMRRRLEPGEIHM